MILETADVLEIIGKHFDTRLDPDKVVIRTTPHFESELCGIAMTATEAASATPEPVKASPKALDESPESIEDILGKSEEIKRADRNTIHAVENNFENEVD